MEIIKEIGHISCSNRSLTNFFSDIKNYKEVFLMKSQVLRF
ncbi:MAG: hypothetical protein CM15mP101_01510 [Flavobacteriaceae bacterium]|nr:MAG: hypothetical protein CM15mP101_01510 [Flavobacteriaceae bacterium]